MPLLQNPIINNCYPKATYRWHKGWAWVMIVLTGLTAFFRFMLPIRDGDIWFHLAYAEFFLKNKTLISDHSIYSWTPATNAEYYCAWLSEIVFYLLYKLGGVTALISFRYLCVGVFLYIFVRYARKLEVQWHPLAWFIAFVSVLMSYVAIFAKPEIFSWILFTLLAWNWWHIRIAGTESWKNNYLFPLIMLVWVNSHGAFVFGLVFLIVVGVGEIANGLFFPEKVLSKTVRKHLIVGIGLSFIVIIINPYGVAYPLQLLNTFNPTPEKIESISKIAAYTQPLSVEANTLLFAYYINIAVLLFVVLVIKNFKTGRLEASGILTTLCFVFLYTQFWRTTFFFAPIFFFASLPLIADESGDATSCKALNNKILGITVIAVAIGLSFATLWEGYVKPEKRLWMGFGVNEGTPIEEVAFINQNYPTVKNIGNSYGLGSYFLWKMWPDKKVFIDARFFPYKEWLDQYWEMTNGKNVAKMLEQYSSDIWVVDHLSQSKLLNWLLHSSDWRLVYYSKVAAIFARKSLDNNETIFHGASLDNIKSPSVILPLFQFACRIGDLPVAEKIIANSRGNYNGISDSYIFSMVSYLDGLKSYRDGDYVQSIKSLSASEKMFDGRLLLSAYVLAMDSLWKEGKLEEASTYALQSYVFAPDSLVVRYNLAVVNWYLEMQGLRDDRNILSWREELNFILKKLKEGNEGNKLDKIIIEDILNGNYIAKPPLITFKNNLKNIESKLFKEMSFLNPGTDN